MKKFALISLALFFTIALKAQSSSIDSILTKTRLHVGLGISVGEYFSDGAIEYIESIDDIFRAESNAFMNFGIRLQANLKIHKYFEFQMFGEYSYAGTSYTISQGLSNENPERTTYAYHQIIPGLIANFHLPVGKVHKNSFFLGFGPTYPIGNFDDVKISGLAGRAQAGFSLNNHKSNIQFFAIFDKTLSSFEVNLPEKYDFSYYSIKLGASLNLKAL